MISFASLLALLTLTLLPAACSSCGGEGEGEGEGEGDAGEGEAGEGEGDAGEGEGDAGEGEGDAGEGEGDAGEGEGEGDAGEGEGEGEGEGDGAHAVVLVDDQYLDIVTSSDGAVTFFETAARLDAAHDRNTFFDVYAVAADGVPRLVSVDDTGNSIENCSRPSVAEVNGEFQVAFGKVDTGIFLSKNFGAAEIVSLQGDGQPASINFLQGPELSRDGTVVAWDDSSGDLATPPFFLETIYYRVLAFVPTTLATQDSIQPNDGLPRDSMSISNDGDRIAYQSLASNLVPTDVDTDSGRGDIFVYERSSDTVYGVTQALGTPDGIYEGLTMSGDGTTLAFFTKEALVADDDNADTDLYVLRGFDTSTPVATRVATGEGSTLCFTGSCRGQPSDLSDDGDVIVFSSLKQLVAGDTNNTPDAYAIRISTGDVELLSRKDNGDASSINDIGGAVDVRVSGDGTTAVFLSNQFDLINFTPTRSISNLPFRVAVHL